jgi:hypothetical protein
MDEIIVSPALHKKNDVPDAHDEVDHGDGV